jgi:uncharacterized RDD family membrane protein YckC
MTEQQALPTDPAGTSEGNDDLWRKEIHARVAGYRTRRGRRVEGAFSMRFPFPTAAGQESALIPDIVLEEVPPQAGEAKYELASTAARSAEPVATLILEAATLEPAADVDLATLEPASMECPAPALELRVVEVKAAPEVEADAIAASAPVPSFEPEPERERPAPAPRPRSRRKVIAFPRQTPEPEVFHRLADPILPEQPRILDVPEELEAFPSTPLLDGLELGPNARQAPPAADHIELPFAAAPVAQRLYAGAIDCAMVLAGSAVFGAVAYKMLPKMSFSKPMLLAAAGVPVVLWAIYQYLFTMYGGSTAGMRMAHIRLSTFKGSSPTGRHRRSRVIGLYFSAASLMMGLLWALVDVDALCWHDRISRTYLTSRE